MDEVVFRFRLDKDREAARWKRVKRKRERDGVDVSTTKKRTTTESAPVVVESEPQRPATPEAELTDQHVDEESVEKTCLVAGFSQVRLDAPRSMSGLKNLDAFTKVTIEVLMWFDATISNKAYFVFFEVFDHKVHVWAYTRTCNSRRDFAQRVVAIVRSMHGPKFVEGVARSRVIPWMTNVQLCAQWGRAVQVLRSMEDGVLLDYPWDSVHAALVDRTRTPTRKWKWKDFVDLHETYKKKLKFLDKPSNVSCDALYRTMLDITMKDAMKFTLINEL